MRFKMFDRIFDVRNMDYGESKVSPYTKREIQSVSIYVDIKDESANNIIQENLSDYEAGNIFSINDEDIKIREYKLVNTSYSYSTNQSDRKSIYEYKFDLEEVEKLEIESLMLGQIEVFPYYYEEEYIEERDALTITAKIKVPEEKIQELDNLDEKNRYFDVVRNGISNDKLKMRFGKGIWSKNENLVKQKLILVEEKYDEKARPRRFPYEPEISNMKEMLAQTKNLNDELIKLLLSKDIISKENIDTIKDESKKSLTKTVNDFYEVKDIDKTQKFVRVAPLKPND